MALQDTLDQLRGLAGLVLVDFIGMKSPENRRLAARRFRQRQRQVAGEVAVRALARALHENIGRGVRGQGAAFLQPGDGAGEDLGNEFFHGRRTVWGSIRISTSRTIGVHPARARSCKGFALKFSGCS